MEKLYKIASLTGMVRLQIVMNVKEELVRVKYRFKDETEFITITVTEQQYINLLELPVIATCEILGKAEKSLSKEEKEKFNEKIKIACEGDQSHTKYLLE